MHVDTDALALLLQMQHIDLEALRAKKQLEGLPQRKAILEARSKRKAVEEKREKLEELRAEAEGRLSRIGEEDARLAEKQRAVQAEIDAVRGDYRSVEARTKELNGLAKRRNVLEGELNSVGEELARTQAVRSQVDQALKALDAQEAAATESFVKEGGALKESLARLEAARARLAADLPEELLGAYEKIAARTGGMAVARLQGASCGACRMGVEAGRLADMKGQGNVAPCPHCGRLLILE